MTIFKVQYMKAPGVPHVYCQLFVTNEPGTTWQLSGNFTLRTVEFNNLKAELNSRLFQFQDVTPKVEKEEP
jgi:hypothetical protein